MSKDWDKLGTSHRAVLLQLNGCPDGMTEDLLKVHGHEVETLHALLLDGYIDLLIQSFSNPPELNVHRYLIATKGLQAIGQGRKLQ